MQQSRRQTFDTIRTGPVLFAGLPGDEVDIDRLMAHLAARGFEGGVCVSDGAGDGVLWIHNGEADEAWFFDASGHEAVLPGVYGHDLLRDIAARGGVVGVVAGAPDVAPPVTLLAAPPAPNAPPQAQEPATAVPMMVVSPPVREHEAVVEVAPAMSVDVPVALPGPPERESKIPALAHEPDPTPPAPAHEPSAIFEQPAASAPPVIPELPLHPWPMILQEVAARVARHRGPRLAALFTSALAKVLTEHGGMVEGDRISAPLLPESTWRVIVESACAPIVSIAGRAFTDRTIAAAERAVREGGAEGGEGG